MLMEDMTFTCLFCEDEFTGEDVYELEAMDEEFYFDINKKNLICPDCYDDWNRLEPEEKIKALDEGANYEWR